MDLSIAFVKTAKDGMISQISRRNILLMVCLAELLLADIAPISGWDAVIGGVLLSLIFPSLSPYLLLIMSTFQDSAGVSGVGWYIGFVSIGFVVILSGLKRFLSTVNGNHITQLFIFSLLVIIYAIFISLAQQYLGGHPQAVSRSPILVGGLMLFMMIVGVVACSKLLSERSENVVSFLSLLLLHSIVVSVMQTFDVNLFHSVAGIVEINKYPQLSVPTALGFPRIAGTYLTPNGWAYCNILLLLLAVRFQYKDRNITRRGMLIVFVMSVFFSLVAFSKALFIFSILSSMLIYWQVGKKRLLTIGLILILVCVVLYMFDLSSIESSFRLGTVGKNSYRFEMWSVILKDFDWHDWLYGVGLGYWPIFFQTHLNVPESDPHSVLLSVPGTFGLPGVFLYGFLLLTLIRRYWVNTGFNKVLVLILFVLFFVKDMISYPYFLGNTPLTALIWSLVWLIGVNEKIQLPHIGKSS